jgi:hypothetical protein
MEPCNQQKHRVCQASLLCWTATVASFFDGLIVAAAAIEKGVRYLVNGRSSGPGMLLVFVYEDLLATHLSCI